MNFHCDICGRDSGIEVKVGNVWVLRDRFDWEVNFAYPIRVFCPRCKGHAYGYGEVSE